MKKETKKFGVIVVTMVLFAGLFHPSLGHTEEAYVIQPVNDSSDIKAFSAQGWLTMQGLPAKDHYLLKISYLRGFLDAVQFAEVAPGQTTQILDDLKGTGLKALTDEIDHFYNEYPQFQSYSPAVVMLVILPRIKAGKTPLPVPGEQVDNSEQPEQPNKTKSEETTNKTE